MRFDCKYAIFDSDGTLLDSMRYWRLAPLEYMIEHDMEIPEQMTLHDLFMGSSRHFIARVAEERGLDVMEVLSGLERCMERHYRLDVREKPGVGAFLEELRAGGAKLCVATAAPRGMCAAALSRLDLLKHFEFVTDGYEVGLHKGEPEFFRIVADRLGADISDCWVFEDALYAMQGAKSAGARVCAIEDYTAGIHREEILSFADRYIADYRALGGV